MTLQISAAYSKQDLFTDPGANAATLDALPETMDAVHQALNNAFIHVWKIRKFYPEQLEVRSHSVSVRSVKRLLEQARALDTAPFVEPRGVEKKVIIDCRSFALLLCAVMRRRGVPARVRCGFASYLEPTHLQDHWICEYWNGSRWVMEDADLSKHDLSVEAFIPAARAWTLCRRGEVEASQFGFSPDEADRGLWAVQLDLLHDVAALCGVVGVSGDVWGLALKAQEVWSQADLGLLDTAAQLAQQGNDITELQQVYQATDGLLKMPDVVTHFDYVQGLTSKVNWRKAISQR